ncbi:MAG: outer membrane lipoprotein carrier protein LolA [Candidatus Ratteibacteria bacterium]|jgi:outer membrane lipoprotein carrier protein
MAEEDIHTVLMRLESKSAQINSMESNFVQTKKLAMFDKPLILKGKIFLKKPGQFAWHQREPMRYSLVIKNNTVRQWDEETGKVQEVSVNDNPYFSAALKQMTEWFSGSYTALIKDYAVTVLKQNPLVLEFVPRQNSSSSGLVKKVEVTFREDERYIEEIYIKEINGDATRLKFTETKLNADIKPDAWEAKPHAD